MPNISFELNFNKHPKDCKNRSLVYARNVQVSNDFTCLQTEHSITENSIIEDILKEKFGYENEYYYRIISAIPCNKEIIFFVDYYTDTEQNTDVYPKNIILIRVNEDKPGINYNGYICYTGLKWHGGFIKGDFTYNIKSQLIIAFSEYDTVDNELIPLKTINLGVYGLDEEDNEQIDKDCDIDLTDDKLSLNPEIEIPELTDFEYVPGRTYKGYYHIFIRYKVNNHDYTKWYNIGYPIFVDEILKTKLFDYVIRRENINSGWGFGITDYFSSTSDVCNKTINLNINHRANNFKAFQIGIINVAKDTSRCFKTLDLELPQILPGSSNFKIDISSMEEYSVNNIIFNRYNYYNVKTIENYQNRLYFSNYKENNFNYDNLQEDTDSIKYSIDFDNNIEIPKNKNNTDINDVYRIYTNDNTHLISISKPTYNTTKIADYTLTHASGDTDKFIPSSFIIKVDKNNSLLVTLDGDTPYNNDFGDNSILNINYEFEDNQIYDDSTNTWSGSATLHIYAILVVGYEYNDNINIDYLNRLKITTLIPGNGYKFYIHYINKYGEHTEGFELTNFISNNYSEKINNIIYIKNKDYSKGTDTVFYPLYKLKLNNKDLLDFNVKNPNIKGFFLSYEKFISNVKYVGVLTKFDFSNDITYTPYGFVNNNIIGKKEPNVYKFYCSELDLLNNIDLNVNKLKLNITNCYNLNQEIEYYSTLIGSSNYKEFKNNANVYQKFDNDSQKSLIDENSNPPYNIKTIDFISAHNFAKDNGNFGSYLKIVTETPISIIDAGNVAVVVLYNDNNNIYLNENKTLIKFTNVIYFSDIIDPSSIPEQPDLFTTINGGYNGRLCYNRYLIYDYNRFILSTINNIIVNSKYFSYIYSSFYNDSKIKRNDNTHNYIPVKYIESINYSDIIYESKCFNTSPEVILTLGEKAKDTELQEIFTYISNTVVQPFNSIDLFKERFGSQDTNNPLTYINYNVGYLTNFDKRIVRSNPIADESFENSWRIVSLEQYKDISENKGNITNIIGIGTTLLVHTEHSLFMFDRNNTLKTGDQDIQLSLPDAFDIDYKEVFTSELGVCGLQDPDAYVVDEFGYIFYDNDAHRLYKFGQGKISFIDETIIQWLNKYKPYFVRFANDKETNRIIVDFWCHVSGVNNKEFTISYNYAINKWISFHDYCFDYAYNTKNLLYYVMLYSYNERWYTKLYYINQLINNKDTDLSGRNQMYGVFHNRRDFIDDPSSVLDKERKNSEINIIVNDVYEVIKTLEYLTWKLYRINNGLVWDSGIDRENYKIPYPGDTIRIFNDIIDTGELDIFVQENEEAEDPTIPKRNTFMNYKKPWWEYGNWNFNYLKDIKNAGSVGDIYSRLIGNYFIIKITFTGVDSRRAEFETLDCKLIQNNSI